MVAAGGWVHTDFLQWWYYQFHFDPLWRVSSGASLGCDLSFSHSRQINYRFFLHFKDLDGRVSAPMCIGGAPALVHYLQCRKRKPKWRREQPSDILQSVQSPKYKQAFSKSFDSEPPTFTRHFWKLYSDSLEFEHCIKRQIKIDSTLVVKIAPLSLTYLILPFFFFFFGAPWCDEYCGRRPHSCPAVRNPAIFSAKPESRPKQSFAYPTKASY